MSCKTMAVCLLALAAPALAQAAQPRMETEQVNLDAPGNLALGGSAEQKLAQVFEVQRKGLLSHVTVPMGCQPDATIIVRIEKTVGGAPSGTVIAEEYVPGDVFSSYPTPAVGFRLVEFGKPPMVYPGHYALTLESKHGDCGFHAGPVADTYLPGRAFFDARPNPPGWIELFGSDGTFHDLAFQVYLRY